MTVTGPLVTRRRLVLVGLEDDRGQAVVPTTRLFCEDAKIDDKTPYIDRKPAGGSAGNAPGSQGEYIGTFSCKADLVGNGDAQSPRLDPGLEVMLLICGMQVDANGVLRPVTAPTDQKTATIYCYQDGILKALCGAMGNASFEGTAGRFVPISFEVQGVWIEPDQEEVPAGGLPTVLPPRFAGVALTLDGWTPRFSKLTLRLGNQVSPREDVGPQAGVLHYCVADRDVRIELDAEAVLPGEHDPFAIKKAGSPAALTATIGSEAGNKFTITAPKVQYREITEGDRTGKALHNLVCQCCFDQGDDEIVITPA